MKARCKYFLILSFILLLCLTACGGETSQNSAVPPAEENEAAPARDPENLVYVPEYYDADGVPAVIRACVIGEDVYLTGSVVQSDTTVDPDTGEEIFYYAAADALFRAPIGGSSFEQWDGYHPFDMLSTTGGFADIQFVYPGKDGSVWVYTDARPEESGDVGLLQNLDRAGNVQTRIDLGALSEAFSVSDIITVVTDSADRLYVLTEDRVFVFDSGQNPLFTVETKASVGWDDRLILLENGQVGLRTGQGNSFTESGSYTLETIDTAANDWGTSYELPGSGRKVYPGGGGYLFFCDSGDSLYGYDGEAEAYERLLSWTGINVNPEAVLWLSALDDGRLAVIVQDGAEAETVLLTKTDPAALPEQTVLTYATLALRSDVRPQIIEFNKTHADCQIEVLDYSEYNTSEDPSQGLRKLSTELFAGKIDILDPCGLPIRQYGSNGILEDLLPWLDSDPELDRNSVMTQVLNAALQDGKLYHTFDSFSILTAAGNPDIVGARLTWTLPDLTEALAKLPEGSTVFGGDETRETVLEKLLPMELDSFVDWDAGTCSFDGDAFRTLLEFCFALPAESEAEEDLYAAAAEGRQLLLCADIAGLDDEFLLYPTAFGGACSFVGYPRADGAPGSCFQLNEGAAMTASCKDKDAAWAFLREAFLPKYPTGNDFGPMLPANASDFDRMIELVTTPNYNVDESIVTGGITVTMPGSSLAIPVRALTQEEYEQFMELYHAIDTVYSYDKSLCAIVEEEAIAYFSGDKTVEETMRLIQNRASLYMQENRK